MALRTPARPSCSASPHSAIEVMKPTMPSAIIALRPRLSDRLAHIGAQTTHSSADQV